METLSSSTWLNWDVIPVIVIDCAVANAFNQPIVRLFLLSIAIFILYNAPTLISRNSEMMWCVGVSSGNPNRNWFTAYYYKDFKVRH